MTKGKLYLIHLNNGASILGEYFGLDKDSNPTLSEGTIAFSKDMWWTPEMINMSYPVPLRNFIPEVEEIEIMTVQEYDNLVTLVKGTKPRWRSKSNKL